MKSLSNDKLVNEKRWGKNKIYSILLTTVFKFSPTTRKEKLEMKNKILGCGLGKKKKKVALEPFQWTHSEGKGQDLPTDQRIRLHLFKLKYNVYNINISSPPQHFWLAHYLAILIVLHAIFTVLLSCVLSAVETHDPSIQRTQEYGPNIIR